MFTQNPIQPFGLFILCLCAIGIRSGLPEENEANPKRNMIIFNDGRRLPVDKILREDQFVVITSKKKIYSHLIADVLYADRDPLYDEARQYLEERRNTLTALKKFRIALEHMKSQGWAAEYCNYWIGESLLRARRKNGYTDRFKHTYKNASYYFKKAIASNPKGRLALEAHLKLVFCCALNDAPAAILSVRKSIDLFEKSAVPINKELAGSAKRWRIRLKLTEARVLDNIESRDMEKEPAKYGYRSAGREQPYRRTLAAYREVQLLCGNNYGDFFAKAITWELRHLLRARNYSEASERASNTIQRFKKAITPNTLGALISAYVCKGKIAVMNGHKQLREGNKKDALIFFSAGKDQFEKAIDLVSAKEVLGAKDHTFEISSAHYFTGSCYKSLGKFKKAKSHFQIILTQFPNSIHAGFASAELEKLKAKN